MPLILWLNGGILSAKFEVEIYVNSGPGCSSMGGLLEELGPFHVNQDGQTVFENVFAWNKVGNVLFLESPRDVGYSFRSNEVGPDNLYNDDKTANDTILALQSFFVKFPEYKNRPFFITGESYGGVYVPTLTLALINQIQSNQMPYVNFSGIAIGNGEMSEIQQINSAVPLLYFRGEHGKEDWDALQVLYLERPSEFPGLIIMGNCFVSVIDEISRSRILFFRYPKFAIFGDFGERFQLQSLKKNPVYNAKTNFHDYQLGARPDESEKK